jgi:prepilin-type processing-associated H-X9-DG protein
MVKIVCTACGAVCDVPDTGAGMQPGANPGVGVCAACGKPLTAGVATSAPPPAMCGLAAAALILGIVGCVPGAGLVALILGIIALNQIDRARLQGRPLRGRGMAVAGIILGSLGIVMLMLGILVSLLIPAMTAAGCGSRRAVCLYNMHTVGIGIMGYAASSNYVPPGSAQMPVQMNSKDTCRWTWADSCVQFMDANAQPMDPLWAATNGNANIAQRSVAEQPSDGEYNLALSNPPGYQGGGDNAGKVVASKVLGCPAQRRMFAEDVERNPNYQNTGLMFAQHYQVHDGGFCWSGKSAVSDGHGGKRNSDEFWMDKPPGTAKLRVDQAQARKLDFFKTPSDDCYVAEPGNNALRATSTRPARPGDPDFTTFHVNGRTFADANMPGWLMVLPHMNAVNGTFLDGHATAFSAGFLKNYWNKSAEDLPPFGDEALVQKQGP